MTASCLLKTPSPLTVGHTALSSAFAAVTDPGHQDLLFPALITASNDFNTPSHVYHSSAFLPQGWAPQHCQPNSSCPPHCKGQNKLWLFDPLAPHLL